MVNKFKKIFIIALASFIILPSFSIASINASEEEPVRVLEASELVIGNKIYIPELPFAFSTAENYAISGKTFLYYQYQIKWVSGYASLNFRGVVQSDGTWRIDLYKYPTGVTNSYAQSVFDNIWFNNKVVRWADITKNSTPEYELVVGQMDVLLNHLNGPSEPTEPEEEAPEDTAWYQGIMSTVSGWFGGLLDGLTSVFSNIGEGMASMASSISNGFSNLGNTLSNVWNSIKAIPDNIMSGLTSLFEPTISLRDELTGSVSGMGTVSIKGESYVSVQGGVEALDGGSSGGGTLGGDRASGGGWGGQVGAYDGKFSVGNMSLLDFYDSFKFHEMLANSGEDPPNVSIIINRWGINRPFKIIDFELFESYRPFVHALVLLLAWLAYMRRLMVKLPNIIFNGYWNIENVRQEKMGDDK